MKKLTAILLFLCILLSGCSKNAAESAAPELLEPVGVNIDTATVTKGDLIDLENYDGSLVPSAEELYFPSGGTIKSIYFYPGQEVSEGDVIMTLDQDDLLEQVEDIEEKIQDLEKEGTFEDQLGALQIAYAQAELDEYNAGDNVDPNRQALLIVNVEEASLQLKQAQESRSLQLDTLNKNLEELKAQLSESSLCAPCDGTVYFGNIGEGTYVQPGKTVCYVINPLNIEFTAASYVAESDLSKYNYWGYINGREWELELVPMSQEEMLSLSVAGKTIYRSFRVLGEEAELKDLEAGMDGQLILETRHLEDVLLVPVNAVKLDDGGRFVYVISENGEREKRYFESGSTNEIYFEVRSGLSEGEVVYVQN